MSNKCTGTKLISKYIFYLLLLSFSKNGQFQGSFIISKIFPVTEEWVVKNNNLGHQLSGDLLNSPGSSTSYGTDLGNYIHRKGFDASRGICVKLHANGSWNQI